MTEQAEPHVAAQAERQPIEADGWRELSEDELNLVAGGDVVIRPPPIPC